MILQIYFLNFFTCIYIILKTFIFTILSVNYFLPNMTSTLWSDENPALYTLTLHCGEEYIALSVGFKSLVVKDAVVYTNGKKVKLRGVNRHESDPVTGAVCAIVTAVTATQNVIDRACELGADALLVHHGWFWRGENPIIVRTKHKRLKAMLMADMNLIAYHLPLDAHVTLGNNAQLGALLGAKNVERFGPDQLVSIGEIDPVSAKTLSTNLTERLGQTPLLLGDTNTKALSLFSFK